MSSSSLARRYARAMIAIGEEEGAVDPIGKELEEFNNVLDLDGGILKNALLNPGIPADQRQAVLSKVLDKLGLAGNTSNFIRLLMLKNRLVVFSDILQAYQEMADGIAGRVRASVETATEIGLEQKDEIRKALAKAAGAEPSQLVVDYSVNKEIIGGIIAYIGDNIYDASIRSRLQDIKHSLIS
jgi:F-type H+-transporting ATPase subunit delta